VNETSLADRLRQGAEQALAPTIARPRRRASPRRRAQARRVLRGASDRGRRDQLIAQALTGYRRGPKSFWAPLLLELLAPKLTRKVARLSIVPPFIEFEDVAQQMVMELLEKAATMPLLADPKLWERALRLDATKEVTRWMRREHRRQADTVSLESLEQDDPDEEGDDD
jgi:hypothetical protein